MSAATENLTIGANGSANDGVVVTSSTGYQTWLVNTGQSVTFLGTTPFTMSDTFLTISGGGTVNIDYGNTVAADSSFSGEYILDGTTLSIDIQDVSESNNLIPLAVRLI